MRILIVGGGIGGLTLAACLHERGFAPTLIERAERWAPVGAGITLAVNAVHILRQLGLQDALLTRGQQIGALSITNAKGQVLSRADIASLEPELGPMIAIHRAALHDVLLTVAEQTNIQLGRTLQSLSFNSEGVRVVFHDGAEETFDLVVGADGIRSQVRTAAFGDVAPRYSGYTCWRLVVEHEIPPGEAYEMWGRGRRFGIVPMAGGLVYCYSTRNAPPNDAPCANITLEDYRELFRDFGGLVPGILGALRDRSELIHNDLEEIRAPKWTRDHVALLGDAAHAMTPNMGQGAGMAIEDAWVLADEIARREVPAEALAAYEARRRARVDTIQSRSWALGRIAQWESRAACFVRDAVVRATPDAAALNAMRKLLAAPV